ncbi:MAG: sigma-70 family RNA polymerase sigma factor [Thermaurantiacus sp.]
MSLAPIHADTSAPAEVPAAPAGGCRAEPGPDDRQFRAELVAIIPQLRAFARGLAGNRDLADDLAQETLAKAWAARASYAPGTNFRAWMFRILRNHFYSLYARQKRMVAWDPDAAERLLVTPPNQGGGLLLDDLRRGLMTLPSEQREALLLLESGMAWEEIATVMECPLGTVKSRITRGRRALQRYLDGPEEVGAPASG